MIEPLLARGKSVVIPPRAHRQIQRDFDKEAYKARHLIENFFCKLKQYRVIATRYDKMPEISSPQSISPLLSFCSIEDRPYYVVRSLARM